MHFLDGVGYLRGQGEALISSSGADRLDNIGEQIGADLLHNNRGAGIFSLLVPGLVPDKRLYDQKRGKGGKHGHHQPDDRFSGKARPFDAGDI